MNREKLFDLKTLLTAHYITGNKIHSTRQLVKMANDCKIKPGEDYTHFDQLYDCAEAFLNEYASYNHLSGSTLEIIEHLESISRLLPTFTERSKDKSLFQQFSTPLPTSYLLCLLADIKKGDIVLEPSAGTGSISCLIKRFSRYRIIVNEIHPFRFALLHDQGYYQVSREDGTQLHNLPFFRQHAFDKIILNPPFSRSIQTGSRVDLLAGAKHVISSFKLLKPGGRMVLLISDSFTPGSRSYLFFLSQTKGSNLILNSTLDEKTFLQKGTSFKTRVMVIEKETITAPIPVDFLSKNNFLSVLNNLFTQ